MCVIDRRIRRWEKKFSIGRVAGIEGASRELAAAFVLHSVVNFSTKANALFDIFLFIGMMTSGCELLLNALLSFLLPFVRWVWNALHDTNNEQTPNDMEMALLARTAGVVPPPDLPLPA